MWNSPQAVATESNNRDTGARWNPLEHAPVTCLPRESQKVVLLGPKVRNGCQRGQELAIGIACFTTWTPLTGDWDTHTHNWEKVNSLTNLASWFRDEERELQCIISLNIQEFNKNFGKHQPGGRGMVCRHKFLQYARKPSTNPQGLGRWCSWPFYCNPNHVTRIFVVF